MEKGLRRSSGFAEELKPVSPGHTMEAAGSHVLFWSWAVETEYGNTGQERLLLGT